MTLIDTFKQTLGYTRRPELAGEVARTAALTSYHTVADRLELGLGGLPQGPFPTMDDLARRFPRAGLPSPMIGTTVDLSTQTQTGLSADELMARARATGANTVRLGAYWSDIQPDGPDNADFTRLDEALAAARRQGLKVVLSVGCKGPGWPEFYVPGWAMPAAGSPDADFRRRAGDFVGLVARHVKDDDTIAMWQVENEPFEVGEVLGQSVGADRFVRLDASLVAAEAAVLRQADGGRRPVMINCWSQGDRRDAIDQAFRIADVVGLDVYPRLPLGFGRYEREVGVPAYTLARAKQTGKPALIAELQADDWTTWNPQRQAHDVSYKATGADVTRLARALQAMGFRDLLFWRLWQNLKDEAAGSNDLTDAERAIAREAGA